MEPISRILDSSSDISPSAPSSFSSTESSTVNTSQTRNVTPPVTPSKRPRSYVSETSSSSILHRPPISEILITTRTQPSLINTPLVHITNPETVEQYVNYKRPTAIKTVRLQPQLNLPDTEYTRLPPLKLPSELSKTSSKLYPPLKPLRKPSTSLSNLLDNTSEYTPSQETTSSLFIPQNRYNLRDLRNYDPIKQFFCLLPYNNTSRPLIVPQENLIHYDDFLLPCNIPTQIVKPLTVIKHLVSSPLDDKDRTYYTALYKQTDSYNELLFISAKIISFMAQAEQKTEHKSHSSPIKNTPDKLTSVLNN